MAALVTEIGRSLGLTNDELGVLRSAAALDDVPSGLLELALNPSVEPEPEETPLHFMALQCLRKSSLPDLERIVPSLPVFPAAALEAQRARLHGLERIASSDPTFCGQIIGAANSARFGRGQRIRTLGQAINHTYRVRCCAGMREGQKVLIDGVQNSAI